MRIKSHITSLLTFVNAVDRIREMFPNSDKIYFKKPIDFIKYKEYDCADLIIGYDFNIDGWIKTDGGWHSVHDIKDQDPLVKPNLALEYAEKFNQLNSDDITNENIWDRKSCEKYIENMLKSNSEIKEINVNTMFI